MPRLRVHAFFDSDALLSSDGGSVGLRAATREEAIQEAEEIWKRWPFPSPLPIGFCLVDTEDQTIFHKHETRRS